jgi:tetratricopeptide (TPR) repeat protein
LKSIDAKLGGTKMQIIFQKNHKIFLLVLALAMTGILATGQLAHTQTNPQNDVQSTALPGQTAPRLQNLGDHKFPVTTNSARAQLFINQAMMLVYGFNHAEATRSFSEAARLDPNCAMAYWGMALVLGPNINMAMPPEAEPRAYAMIQKALTYKKNASEKEKAYIDALAKRYSGDEKPDRSALDRAYAGAMRELRDRYPNDLDIATLSAEAVMDLRPWNYWTRDMQPYPETAEVLNVLESVMARNPNHPGAIHLYIHSVELARPQLAEAAAERLWTLAPGAGHLVHMPSHIFRRIGRYADASRSNQDAIAADEDYITQCRAQGVYPLAYYPHNIHFLWDSATNEGRSGVAVEAARKSASRIPEGAWREVPLLHQFLVAPLFAYTRFGEWEFILNESRPPQDSSFWTGMWHYARGMALTATDKLDQVDHELDSLRKIAAQKSLDGYRVTFSRNGAKAILDIAAEVLAGELAAKYGNYAQAIARLHRGVLLEDNLIYNEPPDWHVPVRQSLGAVLLEAGRAPEAEAVYWQDLSLNRENGWSLFGLMQSLRAQGKEAQAALIETRFQKAWNQADVTLTASRFMSDAGTTVASTGAAVTGN